MESLYFREGLAQVDDILLDSHLGRPYRVSLAEFTAGYVPTCTASSNCATPC